MKRFYLNVEGMSCLGCMNQVERLLSTIEGVEKVEMALAPGQAKILCEDSVTVPQVVDVVRKNSIYRASFDKEEEVLPENFL